MPEIHYIPSAPAKDPEEFLLMAAWALKNRDRFEANTVMDLAQQAITAYIADTTQMKAQEKAESLVTTCAVCGHKTLDPIYIKHPDAHNPYCPECAAAFSNSMSRPAERVPDPEGGVRQG